MSLKYTRAIVSIATAVIVAACASAGVQGSDASLERGLRSLIAAERAFARHSERAGQKEAFVANLGVDGVLFRPGPVNGLEWFRNRPASRGYLSWEPEVAAISSSGDLGYTTGPWEFRPTGRADSVSGAGHYVTVWRRDSTGAWRIAIDIGTSHRRLARPADASGTVTRVPGSLGAATRQQLLQRDSALGSGGVPQNSALLGAMLDDARLHREGAVPALGIEAIRSALREDDRPYHSKPLGGSPSRAGDFGYSYGEYEMLPTFNRAAERGFYLRIWRLAEDGSWGIMLDLAQPVRPATSG